MAALSPPRLFCRLASRGTSFCGFPFRWVLHFVLFLTRGIIVHDAASCSMEDSLYERVGPCDTLSCFVQEIQSVKDIDVTCSKTFPIKAATCLQVGPMSLDWPVDPFAKFDHCRSSLSPEVPSDEQQRGALPASTRSRWRQNILQAPPQVLQRTTGCDGCALSFPETCGVLLGIPEVSLDLFSLSRKQELKLKYLKKLFTNNNIVCLQEVHGKDEYPSTEYLCRINSGKKNVAA